MNPTTLRNFAELKPTIKAEWTGLLHGEPALTPLGRPDTLVFLMDATLGQLLAGLSRERAEDWIQRCPALIAPVHGYCACGLNPLLKYFATGELALRVAAGSLLSGEIEIVLKLFRSLAQQEIATLCTVCQHKDDPACCEKPKRHSDKR